MLVHERRAVVLSIEMLLHLSSVSNPDGANVVNCSRLVTPVDAAPIRSPQRVHTAIASHLHGKSVLEIGTRNGDGMACMAQVATRAYAVELSKHYCKKLESRSAALSTQTGHRFNVVCQDYRVAESVDADVYTWWQAPPHLHNPAVLLQLRRLQLSGKIRQTAEAIFVFDQGWKQDMLDFADLQKLGWANWTERVGSVHERKLCLEKVHGTLRRACHRVTNGTYYIARVELSRVSSRCPEQASDTWRRRCGTKQQLEQPQHQQLQLPPSDASKMLHGRDVVGESNS